MKNLSRTILVLALAMACLASCSENPGTATMKLILRTGLEPEGKTLAPSNSSLMDVTKYTVVGNGPNGKTFTKSSASDSIVIDGLTIGDWTISARGLNSENTELCSGTLSFRLTGNSGPQTVVLDTLVGTGTFVFSMDWSLCDIGDPDVKVYLSGPESDAMEMEIPCAKDLDLQQATVSTSLSSGSYTLRVLLMDGSSQVGGFIEAVRISNGMSTTGSYQFNYNLLGPSTLTYFKDATGTPIKGSLSVEGSAQQFVAGNDYSFLFSFDEPDKVYPDGLSIQWYLDGVFVQSSQLGRDGSSMTITPGMGTHRVDAVVFNRLLGSTGSASYSFSAKPNGVPGEAVLIQSDCTNGFAINPSSMVGALPDDRVLVFDPVEHRLMVCGVNGTNVNAIKTYTADDFGFFNGVKKLFSDRRMNQFVLTYGNAQNKESFAFMNVDDRGSVTLIESWEGQSGTGVDMGNLCAVDFNPTRSLITICDNTSRFDCVYYVTSDTAICRANNMKYWTKYYSITDAATSEHGNRYAYASSGANVVMAGYMTAEAGYVTAATESEELDSYMTHLGWVGDSIIVGGNGLALTTFRLVEQDMHTILKSVPIYVSMMEMNYTTGNTYIADNGRRIVSFYISSGGNITMLGSCELGQVPVSMALMDNYVAVVTADGRMALLAIVE